MYERNPIRRTLGMAARCIVAGAAALAVIVPLTASAEPAPADDSIGQGDIRYVNPQTGGFLPPRGVFVAEDDPRWDCRVDGDQDCGAGMVIGNGHVRIVIGAGYYGQESR